MDSASKYDLVIFVEIFKSLVNRSPNAIEVDLFVKSKIDLEDASSVKLALLDSPERLYFNARELWERCLSADVEPTFFLHLDRTGGTAFTAAVSGSLGLPAMLVQNSELGIPISSHRRLQWPFKTGHVPIAEIEKDLTIVSIARDPRTRLLSRFRFKQNQLAKLKREIDFNGFSIIC